MDGSLFLAWVRQGLVKSGVAVVRDRLNELMPQFKEEQPAFYNAYFAARVVVPQRGKREDKSKAATDATPATPTPLDKAA
jgi:hypothetical protein